MIAYGPVPSRRLGRSLGINNIPPKACTYSCSYCQLGVTIGSQVERREFYGADKVMEEVKDSVKRARQAGEQIDYLSFVPDGEPTLDVDIEEEIRSLKELGIDIAVVSNASLMWREDVRKALLDASWVSLKIDTYREGIWRRVNKPHDSLDFDKILDGLRVFSDSYENTLSTETMLIKSVNDSREEIENTAEFLKVLDPDEAYIAIPTRPPAVDGVLPADEETMGMAYRIFSRNLKNVELLMGYEGNEFSATGDPKKDLLNITAVHPMREEGVKELLSETDADWNVVEELIDEGKMIEIEYGNRKFFMRRLPGRKSE